MKTITQKLLGTLAIAALLSTPMQAQVDCNLTFTLESECYAEDLGWGFITDIDGAITPYEYLWSNGATVQYVDGLMNGDHWGMVTDAAGCTYKVEFTVDCAKDDEPVECDLSFMLTYECYAENLGWALVTDIVGATVPYTYLWSNGATVQYVDGLMNGDHWVMVTDADGCSYKTEFSLDCSKDDEPSDCQLRTQTQGGWGAPANGNNPGTYRNANFAGAFPMGLTIGCDYTLTLTSAAAVQAFLPSGSTPSMLPGNLVDPGNSYNNVLAGQLVALTLSVGFDLYDPNFAPDGVLANAVINNGMFAGWSVSQLLDEANSFIGGCGSSYSASDLNAALSMVNENYVDGTVDLGNLDCAEEPEPCELRTQTQGGWGSPANGNNPGTYRNANFSSAFPAGLTIGCTRTLTLTSAAAVQAFLPSGTTPRMLNTGNMVDPGTSYKNVLAGQLVALTLSVGFDMYDPDFGMGGLLADAVINNGTFEGWTVSQLLDEANSFIGGCGSSYTAAQLNNALAMVNENFVDGDTDLGNVDCSGMPGTRILMNKNQDHVLVFPNPASDRVTVDLTSNVDGVIMINVLDALGRTINTTSRMNVLAGDQQHINISVDHLQNGSYFLMITRDGELMQTQRLIVNR